MKKLSALILGCLVGSSSAETTNTVSEIIVSASRSTRPTITVPLHTSIITDKDIARQNRTTLPEILSGEAGIFFRNYADNPSQANIDMRGFGENSHGRVLVLLNGRKLNNPDMATVNWSQVSIPNIKRIEILRGPGTAAYGDNASGGVINVLTREGSEEAVSGLNFTAGSYNLFHADIYTSGRIKDLGYFASFNQQQAEGYRDNSEYQTRTATLNLDGNITETLSSRLALSFTKRDFELPGDLTQEQKKIDREQSLEDSDVKEETFNGDLGFKWEVSDSHIVSLDAGILSSTQEANLNREWGIFASFMDTDRITATVSPKYTTQLPIGKLNNELTIGTDIRHEEVDIQMFGDEDRSMKFNNAEVVQESIDLFAIDSLYLSDTLILTASGRLNWNKISVTEETSAQVTMFDESEENNEQAASLGLTWLPGEKTKVYIKADRFFRYPFVDEQASYLGFLPSAFTDIDPETGYNIEVGTDFSPVDPLRFKASVYYMPMEDEIAFNPSAFVNENLDDTRRTGGEISMNFQPVDIFSLYACYAFTVSEFDSGVNDGNQVPGVPTHRARIRADLNITEALLLSTDLSFTGSQNPINDNGNNAVKQDSYALVNSRLSYSNHYRDLEYKIFVGVYNLFEEHYDYYQISNASGSSVNSYPAAERSYRAGVSISL